MGIIYSSFGQCNAVQAHHESRYIQEGRAAQLQNDYQESNFPLEYAGKVVRLQGDPSSKRLCFVDFNFGISTMLTQGLLTLVAN